MHPPLQDTRAELTRHTQTHPRSTLLPTMHSILSMIALIALVMVMTVIIDAVELNTDVVMKYVMDHRPSMDKDIPLGYVHRNAELAIDSWHHMPWCGGGRDEIDERKYPRVPMDLFLNDVAPYAVMTERRDDWRGFFYQRMKEYLHEGFGSCSSLNQVPMKDVAKYLNRKSWSIVNPPIKFQAAGTNMLNNYAVFDTMKWSNASCTGESVFLVYALRSVCIPARIVGCPHWNRPNCKETNDSAQGCGNHNWVEAWLDGEWMFIDQNSETPMDANEAWFFPKETNNQVPFKESRNLNHTLLATSWKSPKSMSTHARSHYPETDDPNVPYFFLAWEGNRQSGMIHAWDRTKWYLEKGRAPFAAVAAEI